jgi:hypothetical protein
MSANERIVIVNNNTHYIVLHVWDDFGRLVVTTNSDRMSIVLSKFEVQRLKQVHNGAYLGAREE